MISDTRVNLPSVNTEGSETALAATRYEQLGAVQESLDQHTARCPYFAGNKEKKHEP